MDKVYSVEELKEILYNEFFIITDTPQDGICYLREDGMFLYFDEDLVVDYFDHLPTHGIEIDWLLEERYISSDFDLFFGLIPDLNDGYYREEESRISLSTIDKLTAQQYSSLKLWIEKVIYLDNRVDGLTVVTNKPFGGRQSYVRYPLYEPGTSIVRDDISANYIINRIKRYFSTGQLLESKRIAADDLGRPLSKEQQKYFKNSKVRDINGNLLTVYHGTKSEDFDVFDNTIHSKEVGSHFGTKEAAAEFGPSREYYLNIINPLQTETDMEEGWDIAGVLEMMLFKNLVSNLTTKEVEELKYIWNSCFIGDYNAAALDDIVESRRLSKHYLELDQLIVYGPELVKAIRGTPDWSRAYDKQNFITNIITSRGHDGIKYINTVEDAGSISWITFKPNQIKLVTNKTPTNSDSIKENINKGETNMKVKEFNEVGEVIAKHLPNVDKIELDAFTSGGYNYEYLVVTFRGGSISVRNVAANSLIANLQELALLLNGGYYREVETYKKLKEADTLSESKEWKEDNKEQLTYQHLLDFATDLSRSQGSYGRIARDLRNMYDWEIEELNEQLIELGYRNDLMTIIDIFEG